MTNKVIVHRAEVRRLARDRAEVVLDDAYRYEGPYRKSWSARRYVDDAMAHLNLAPAWGLRYSFDLRAPRPDPQ